MLHKILAALVESRMIRTTIRAISNCWGKNVKLLTRLRTKADKALSIPAIYIMSRLIPVDENKILFVTFRGEYDCNAKWIAEEIKERKLPYHVVWTIRKKVLVDDIPESFTKTFRGTLDFYRHLSSARIIVDNGISTANVGYFKKHDQILIETWHGSLGIKKFSRDTNKDKRWVAFATLEGKMTDYCLSNSAFEDDLFRDTFWGNTKILRLGHARNDILCEENTNRLQKIREKVYEALKLYDLIETEKRNRLNRIKERTLEQKLLPWLEQDAESIWNEVDFANDNEVRYLIEQEQKACEDLRICLYAPTFRDDGDMRPYQIDYQQLRTALTKRFGGTWVILTRFHWRLLRKTKNIRFGPGVINASKYSDIQELLTCTDVGITDYSSWICDYLLTKRPGFLFATDMVEYEKKDREFFYPLETLPYPLALDNEQLIECILSFDDTNFVEKCESFLKNKGCIDDGNSSLRIVDAIEVMMRGETIR